MTPGSSPPSQDAELERLKAELETTRLREQELDANRRAMLALLEDLQKNRRQIETARAEWTAAFDAVLDPIFIHDAEFRIVRANHAYAERAGMSYEDIIGKPYWEVFPHLDGPLSGCGKMQQTGAEEDEEVTLESGEIFQSRAYPLHDASGRYLQSIHILTDMTQHRLLERELADSEETVRSITGSARDAMLMLDQEGKVQFWNQAAERMFGYTRAEAVGQSLADLIIPDRFRADHCRGYAKFAQTGQGAVIGKVLELSALRKDGSEFIAEHSISAVNLRGRWHAIGTMRDITERKQAEQVLRASEARYRNYIELTGQLEWTTNAAGEVESDIPTWRQYTGQSEEEIKGCGWIEALHPDDREATAVAWKQAVATKGPYEVEYRVRRHDGEYRTFMARGVPIIDDNGVLREWVGTCIDITEHIQHEAALQRLNRVLRTLSDGNMALVHASDETGLLESICRAIVEQGGYRLAWVGYAEQDEARSIRPQAHAGEAAGYLDDLQLTWADSERGRGPSGTAIRTGKPSIAQNIQTDPAFAPWREEAVKRGYSSSIGLPLFDAGQVFGVLNIYSGEPEAFDDDEVRLLEELASDLAYGILSLRTRADHERLEIRQHETAEKLHQTMVATVTAMSLAVEKRDPYTAGHHQRVAYLAVAIARELGLEDERIEGIRLGGIVHDIGKLYVPAEILNRPGRLTDAEFEIIKSHPQVGYDILKGVDFPWPVVKMVYQHHERLDGSGYPQGLKGDEICPEAQILAVADVVEAMASHRPYRPGLGIDAALAEIGQHRGTWFDPDVVDVCMRLFTEQGFTLEAPT